MSKLFIPPEGAMQFEITHPGTKFYGENFWVLPFDGKVNLSKGWPQCRCRKYFEAIMETVSPSLEEVLNGNNRAVCLCVGRIIE
jgi:hypothetical protein